MGKLLAISKEGAEFLYKRESAHRVSNAGAEAICKALNENRYKLKPGEVWNIHDCTTYEYSNTMACVQSFTRRSGKIYEHYRR